MFKLQSIAYFAGASMMMAKRRFMRLPPDGILGSEIQNVDLIGGLDDCQVRHCVQMNFPAKRQFPDFEKLDCFCFSELIVIKLSLF